MSESGLRESRSPSQFSHRNHTTQLHSLFLIGHLAGSTAVNKMKFMIIMIRRDTLVFAAKLKREFLRQYMVTHNTSEKGRHFKYYYEKQNEIWK